MSTSSESSPNKTEEKEQVKINEYEVLLSTDDPKERDKAAKILVQKCFERAFGKEFLEDIKNEEMGEVKAHKYNFDKNEPDGQITKNFS